MPRVHPTACIDAGARIAEDADIGPYCVVGPDVEIGAGVRLLAHVNVAGATAIGARTVVYPFASLGTPPQSVHYRGGRTRLVIGADCKIREHVTMNTGSEDGGGITRVGDRGFFMVNSHVAHDCQVGNDVTFANNAVLGGHVLVGDHAFLGGQAAVHQFVRVGESAMIGGVTGVRRDVIPFGFASGQEAELVGLNVIGLKRRGCSRNDLHRLRRLYQALFFGPGTLLERLAEAAGQYSDDPYAAKILAFIRDGSSRHFTLPATPGRGDGGDG
jgi:UDP-N-acetylglucosamine acyltransferase